MIPPPPAAFRAAALLALVALLAGAAGCAGLREPAAAGPAVEPAPPPAEPAAGAAEAPPAAAALPEPEAAAPAPEPPPAPPPAAPLPLGVRYVHGAEFRAAVIQTYRTAARELERLAEVLVPGAWAVVLDVDDTVLSNAPFERELAVATGGGMTFDRALWNAWVERRAAAPLPGARAFVERVRELGGVVALVTNRAHEQCPATEDNLRARGVPYDVILCRPPASDGEKEPRFESLRAGTAAGGLPPLEIVMFVGDNIGDFPGLDQGLRRAPESAFEEFGSLYFVVPNPMYGSWESVPVE
jgi:5'-nucleotidase (lipoprotein e(P4) family)